MVLKKHFPFLFLMVVLILACNPEQKDHIQTECKILSNRADGFYKTLQLDSAYAYYNKAIECCSNKTGEQITYSYLQTATIQQHIGDLYGTEETITLALSNYKGEKYKPYLYNILAISYDKQKRYDEALKNYVLAKELFKSDYEKATAESNIGLIHLEKGDYNKAITILKTLSENKEIKERPNDLSRVLDNLGYAQFKNKNPEEAFPNLTKALTIRINTEDKIGQIASNIHLSEYYLNLDEIKSMEFANQALKAAQEIDNPDDKLEALQLVIQINKSDTNSRIKTYLKLNDSLYNARQNDRNQFAKIKYDFKDNLQKYQLQKTQSYLYLVLLLLFSGAASFIIVTIRKRNREKIKTISYETETRIAKKIHDELANDVFNALTFAESQNLSDPNKKEALLDNLDTIYNRTRNISRENSEIKTDSQFPQQLTDLLKQYESDTVRVIIQEFSTINWDDIKKEAKIAIYRVLQELMVNMKKHSECTFVILKFSNQKSHIEINYSDNGKGVKMLNSKKGLQNAENRINVIKGTLTFDFETEKGFKASIKIPK